MTIALPLLADDIQHNKNNNVVFNISTTTAAPTPMSPLRTLSSSSRACGSRVLQATNMPLHRQYILQLSIGVLISISNGAIFCFGIFSPYLKQAPFEFTQSQVNTIATAGAMASFITPPVGYLFDQYGARITLAAGAGLNLLGWVGLYFIFISASQINPSSSLPPSSSSTPGVLGSNVTTLFIILIAFSLSQMSSPFYEQGSVLANLQGLSTHRGKVVLIQKTFMGLGSGLISQLYSTFFVDVKSTPSPSTTPAVITSYPALENLGYFCLMLAAYSVITGVMGALVTNVPKGRYAASLRVPGINNGPTIQQSLASSRKVMNSEGACLIPAPTAAGVPSPLPLPVVLSTSPSNLVSSPIKILSDPDDNAPATPTMMTASARFTQLNNEEVLLSKQFNSYFRPATILTLILVALVAIITIVDTYWSTSLKEDGKSSSAGFDAWQLWTSIISMGLCALFVPMVYLVPLRVATSTTATTAASPPVEGVTVADAVLSPNHENGSSITTTEKKTHQQQREQDNVCGGGGNLSDSETKDEREIKKKNSRESGIVSVNMIDDQSDGARSKIAAPNKFELNTHSLKVNLLSSPNWWFLWLQCFSVWGVATLVSTNSSQIYYALDPNGYSDTSNAAMVSIFGVASALGRVLVGALVGVIQGWRTSVHLAGSQNSDQSSIQSPTSNPRKDNIQSTASARRPLLPSTSGDAQPQQDPISNIICEDIYDDEADGMLPTTSSLSGTWNERLSRTKKVLVRRFRSFQPDELIPIYFLLVPSFILSVGLPLFLISPPGMLLVCFFLVGFAAGFTYGSVILVVSGLLSQDHAGKHYGFVGSAGFATPILFNIVIFAQTYDEVGTTQAGFAANNNQCVGRECLYTSLLVSTALSILAFVLMVVLVRRVIRDGRI